MEAGIALIKEFEGFRPEPYLDAIGVPTIGYGSIWGLDGQRVSLDHPSVTEPEGEQLMMRDILRCQASIARLINVPLNAGQNGALLSFTYNLGGGALQRSTLRQKLNRGDYEDAVKEFPKWCRAGGRILLGLVRRRAAEAALFTEGW